MINVVFTLFSLISSVVCLFFGSFVYYQNRKQLLNKIFFLLCLSLTIWAFTEFMLRQAESFETAYFWMVANILWPFAPAFALHFILIYTGRIAVLKNKLIYPLIYIPAFIFSFCDLLLPAMKTEVIKEYWGYSYYVPNESWMYWISEVWVFVVAFIALILGVKYFQNVYYKYKKRQVKLVVLGFSIPIFIGLLSQGLFPILQIKFPELTTLAFTGLCLCVGYSIREYKLFVFTPATVADNIIATMSDSLFLADFDGKILKTNSSLLNLLGFKEEELIGNSVNTLFGEEQFGNTLINNLLEQKTLKNYETKYKMKSGEGIDINFSGSLVIDEDGRIKGIIGVAHDITENKKAEKKLKEKINELEKYKQVTVDRELKMIELKKKIEKLEEKRRNRK